MDKKYYINKDATGKINWVGIEKEAMFDVVEIKDADNKPLYDYQLHAINAKTNGEFFEALENNNVTEVGKALFVSQPIQKPETVKTAEEPIKKGVISKKLVAVGVAAGILLASTTVLALNDTAQAKANAWFGKKAKSSNELTEDSLENKSVNELIEMLNDEEQEEAFHRIVDTQDYFNEEAAPTVKQGDKQLYINFDETTAAYLYANAKSLGSEKLASFFGKSKIMVLNEETGEYEQMDQDLVSAKYLSFCLNLSYYYQLGATEKSGVDGLFENEKEAEFFRNFEAKILDYNKSKSSKKAAEIRKELENIFMSGNVDTLMDKYSGATSIIGTAIIPHLYLNGVIDKDMYNSLVEINETITCQSIYSQIGKILNCKIKANGKEEIIEKIAELQFLKTKDLNRNISLEEALEGYRYSDLDLYGAVLGATPGFASSKTVTEHYRKVTSDREEAIKHSSEEQVKEAEEAADSKIEGQNQDENDYWDGYMAGYNKAYDNVWGGGSGNVSVPSGSAKYVQGFKAGIEVGKKAAKEDKKQAEQAQQEHKPQHHEEIVEETFVEESESAPEQHSTPHEEIVEETFVYEQSNSSDSAEKVTQIESHEEIVEEKFIYEPSNNSNSTEKAIRIESDEEDTNMSYVNTYNNYKIRVRL